MENNPAAPAPLPRRQVILTMGGLMLALFLASLDQTVVSTAMPRIIADLGGFDRFTWVTTAYLVASTTTVPIVGRLSDLYGRKAFFLGGIAVFLVGSVLAGVSQSMNQLIVFRAIQGIGGGSMMALSFTTVGDLFPPAERGKYQGIVAAVFGLSSVIGPTLGGFITDNLSWNWIFYVNVPLGLPVIGLFIRFFPNTRPERRSYRARAAPAAGYNGIGANGRSVQPASRPGGDHAAAAADAGQPAVAVATAVRAAPQVAMTGEPRGRVHITYDLDEALADADVVMALRLQKERQTSGLLPTLREYSQRYGLTADRIETAKHQALVMHPGPMNEGVEITPEVAQGQQSVIEEQVQNGLAVRMALLYLLAGGQGGPVG